MPKHNVRAVIVGSGASGIIAAVELRRELGIEATIYEKSSRAGGTWEANIYPGCACDVPSHWYSWSKENNPEWSQVYSAQPEIKLYWDAVAKKHQLEKITQFGTKFVSAVWSDKNQFYTIEFERVESGELFTVEAEVFVSAMGGLSIPLDKPSGMKGIESFTGDVFHSARWDYNVNLVGKKVAVIGNGCSASQFVPIIAEEKSTEVMNFVRTPNYYMPRPQATFSDLTKWAFRNVPGVMSAYRGFIATTSDLRYVVWQLNWGPLRHYVEEVSVNYIMSQTPEKYHAFLTPRYPFGCKRVIMDPGYLASLNRSNVDMITDPISSVTPGGIIGKSGKEYEFDVLILATGFVVGQGDEGANITGRDGKTLSQQWKAQNGAQAYLSTSINNFPNFFSLLGPNAASGHASAIYSIEAQVDLMIKLVEPMVKYGVTSLEVKVDAEKSYNVTLQERLKKTVWNGGCDSWYTNEHGKNTASYPGMVTELVRKCANVVWEDYSQVGGTKRLAVSKLISSSVKNVVRAIALFSLIFYVRSVGLENLKGELILFLLLRVQQAKSLIAKVL